ncbi:ATP-binding protein [Succinatimonas hippei]|uniref:ATP-binding protein n=1 Tax=Succinatimonas hippei TaxID=626938 RepID=UPI0025A41637|nr:ATP-binding protein [Succinatimonas hippei]MDM8119621.1 ATP-binding protein [Succinatimonas hippei]
MKKTKLNLLQHLSRVADGAEKSKLENDYFAEYADDFSFLTKHLELTKEQIALFSIILGLSLTRRADISEITDYLGCKSLQFLTFSKDIEALVDKEFILKLNNDEMVYSPYYIVPAKVVKNLETDFLPVVVEKKISSDEDLIEELNDLFSLCDDIAPEELQHKISFLLKQNDQIVLSQTVVSFELGFEIYILLYMCVNYVINDNNCFALSEFRDFYDRSDFFKLKKLFNKKQSALQKLNLIEKTDDGPMFRRNDETYYALTDNAFIKLLSDFNFRERRAFEHDRRFISYEKTSVKQLIYDADLKQQLNGFASLLEEKKFNEVVEKLKDRGMRSGFTCIFYGYPGTGKTESVLQIAKLTKRNIWKVDIANIFDKYVGESEKNIRKIFDDYRELLKKSKTAPILLFNEADAVIGKRIENVSQSVDQMQNTVQNIILEELENFEGILIATTNLTVNLDKAFERRFLYKVKFEKPSNEISEQIWKGFIDNLSDKDAKTLAKEYSLSPGQIENVSRKYTIDNILFDSKEDLFTQLTRYCKEEFFNDAYNQKSSRRIGF